MIKRPLCLAAVFLLGIQAVLVGGLRIAKDLRPSPLELGAEEKKVISLMGTVSQREEKPKYQVYYLTDNQVRLEEQIIEESKILVYVKRDESQTFQDQDVQEVKEIAVGNTLYLTGEVRFFQEATNPGNFDQKFYYQKQGIHASVWSEDVRIVNPRVWHVREWLSAFRCRWKKLMVSALGDYYGNSMSAILLGDKSELDSELKELYQKSGIGHILAISGLHMSFLGTGFYKLLRKSGLSFLQAGLAGILFLMFYTLMIGWGVSSLRALVMFLVRIGADMSGRTYDLPTSLATAAAVVVMWQPLYLLDAGFLLSFGAILGIVLVYPVLDGFHAAPRPLCAGLSIHLMLLPVMLYYYFEFPLYSLLLNLLVVPLMSVILGAGLAGSVLSMLWAGGGMGILQVCKGILWVYERACGMSMELPAARIVVGRPGKMWMAAYYIVLLGGCMAGLASIRSRKQNEKEPCGKSQKMKKEKTGNIRRETRFVRTVMVMLPAVFCLTCACSHGKQGELQAVMLDVGQGDGLYIRTPSGRHYLIDGGSTDVSKVGTYRIEPFLKSRGVRELDYVFISHGDADHINGVEELLENQTMGIRIRTLVLPDEQVLDEVLLELAKKAESYGTKVVTIRKGQQIQDSGMTLTCLAPAADYGGEIGNASSMVLALKYQKFDMLFTGDVEGDGEYALTESGLLQKCDILKVAHHGSKNSTSDAFLEEADPAVGFISAGRKNRYSHPHQETLERLRRLECRLFSTQDCGAVTMKTDGSSVDVEGYLGTNLSVSAADGLK